MKAFIFLTFFIMASCASYPSGRGTQIAVGRIVSMPTIEIWLEAAEDAGIDLAGIGMEEGWSD